jgi:hypothetical protein
VELPRQWALFAELDGEVAGRQLRHLVTPELVDEHARVPLGPHSPDLARVLDVLRRRRGSMAGKHVVVEHGGTYRLGRLAGFPGGGVEVDPSVAYGSRGAAEHAVLCRRLEELGLIGTDG